MYFALYGHLEGVVESKILVGVGERGLTKIYPTRQTQLWEVTCQPNVSTSVDSRLARNFANAKIEIPFSEVARSVRCN